MRRLTSFTPHFVFLAKSLKTKSVIQRRLEFSKAVRFGRYFLSELVWWVSRECWYCLGRILNIRQVLDNKSAIQCRLDFLKAVRFWRYLLSALVWWASCEGLHSLGSILNSSEFLEKQICDPASAGFFEGRQIWEIPFKRTRLVGFMRRLT